LTQEELDKLTPEERERLAQAEQEALRRFYNRMNEGRRTPRRHERFALFVLFGVLALGLLAAVVGYLVMALR
jgi:hypothetical protein